MTTTDPPNAFDTSELPVHLTRFVGRDAELDDLEQLVRGSRLLTLTGAGGSGKTRLARETARRMASDFARLAWVDLAPLASAQLIGQQVAGALHAADRSGMTPLELVVAAIGGERVLLMLDNCEHVVDACAEFADALLRACPRLVILATSREALGVDSETAWLVPPLARDEAIQLFVERARAALPSFALTSANTAALEEICRRLDGIPLAIELAAARVRVLSPEQIARRLDDAFRLLTTGNRTALPRHRTLRATMEWSFALLGAREQVLLRRLAIFAGSFTLDAAEAVASGAPLEAEDILDGVSALVDKSLVGMDAGDGIARYRLLETVRQYGMERLSEAGEQPAMEARYADYFLGVIEAVAPTLVGGARYPALLARVVAEQDNLRAATLWAVADASRAECALRFVGSLYWFWYALGQFRESRQLTDRALALNAPADPLLRGRAMVASALTALSQGEYVRSCAEFNAALPLLRASGDLVETGAALAKLGGAYVLGGEVAQAIATLDEALELTRDAPPDDIAAIFARFWRAWAAYLQSDFERARELLLVNVRIGRDYVVPTTLAHTLAVLGQVEFARENVEEACMLVTESIEREVAIGDGWGVAIAMDVVVLIAARRGQPEVAVKLIAALEAHRERLALALPGLGPVERESVVAGLRTTLGVRFDSLHAEGRELSTQEAISMALAEAARHTTEHRVPSPAMMRTLEVAIDTPSLRVWALGPLQVSIRGKVIEPSTWGSARPRELLAYLLMHPEGRTKEQIGLCFWPDASSAQLRNNFHVTLHRLRKALGNPAWVTLSIERYSIDPMVLEEFDVSTFEKEIAAASRAAKRHEENATALLEQAVSTYRGDLLDGEPVGDWHLEHRDALQRQYVDALMSLGARHLAEERQEKAADAYRRVLARDELHEDALLALMRCHAQAGERSQALRLYRRFAERLRDELDARPGKETTRLFESLQHGAAV